MFFFFQAEDGIRDLCVTGVQTCALPIWSGRHGGCRLRFAPDGALLVGTGDNARGSNPQDTGTLAGKVLRVDAATGAPAAGNPLPGEGPTAYIASFGHRNVQ